MSKTLKCTCQDEIKVVPIDDLKEFLENNFNKTYFYKKYVEIECPDKTRILSMLCSRDNVRNIEIDDNENLILNYKNGSKETLLENDLKNSEVIFFKLLQENDELVKVDTINLLFIELDNYFRTNIDRKLTFEIPEDKEELTDSSKYKNIKYLIGFIPNKIFNLSSIEYSKKIKENNHIRFKFDTTEDLSKYDNSFYENRKIKVLDYDIFSIENYLFLKTFNNNLLVIDKQKLKD